jgi:hypothetical protein
VKTLRSRICTKWTIPAACGVLLLVTGCSDSHESLTRDAIAIMNETADVLATIKDSASADAAKSKLKGLGERWRDNHQRRAAKKSIAAKELVRLEKHYGAQTEAATKRYLAEVLRVRKVDGGEEALRELGDVQPHVRLGHN